MHSVGANPQVAHCVQVLDDYLVVVLILAVPLLLNVLDGDRVAYLGDQQVPAPKNVFDDPGCFRPVPRADYLAVLFAADQAAQSDWHR
jgi:hypothetical protein